MAGAKTSDVCPVTVFEQTLNRRTAIGGAAAAGAAAVLATGSPALAASPADPRFRTAVEPGIVIEEAPGGLLPADPLLHLLRRATFGPSPAAIAQIRTLG